MAEIRPFGCIRPAEEVAPEVAALPYDVYSRNEAKQITQANPLSFLAIDRAETQFPDDVEIEDPRVYEKARDMIADWCSRGIFVEDKAECYYVYALTMEERTQTGIVACASVDDYVSGTIRKHENTREEKEQDRIHHVNVTNMHTGPIFLAYRADQKLNELTATICREQALYDFVSEDGIRHQVWRSGDAEINAQIHACFAAKDTIYIADGHHRAASAVKVGLMRRTQNPGYTGDEPFNYFLSVLFPDDQLMILPYNRQVRDLNGLTREAFLEKAGRYFVITDRGEIPFQPAVRRHIGMYLDGRWYELAARPEILPREGEPDDPVRELDVTLLQETLLGPVLGIENPRTDERIRFVGGIRGLDELKRPVDDGTMAVAFSMYPTSIGELFAVADAGLLMPSKSTWFEPKLRSGLFLHRLTKD